MLFRQPVTAEANVSNSLKDPGVCQEPFDSVQVSCFIN